ncbi:hypothetical protein S40285_00926 [Stachybotrys chlorohalonatus IBT 40285]|uniref:Tafazzin n=1 Tax=Stachybotrys chlorohalonatus (strain IBT 40285) TaxID=1283841 RepID=A0A084QUP5_STAC4|nr:hypothetical protein S40285_00926 [Stachybotrys chlorohalonata IBT 40285]
MPKKRNFAKSFKPSSPLVASPPSQGTSDKPQKGVNELLANLRRTPAGPSATRPFPATVPSVPPAIRELLQLPETPPPAPKRQARRRFDANGRRLPAGPPPPQSWTARPRHDVEALARFSALRLSSSAETDLPGTYMPKPGSLVDIVLRRLVADWDFHKFYNKYYLYSIPSHLKPALIRYLGTRSQSLQLTDLRIILLPPADDDDDSPHDESISAAADEEVTYLDLSGAIGKSLALKDISEMLFPPKGLGVINPEPTDSWEAVDASPNVPRVLLPNLSHLSLALEPDSPSRGSWKQLLALSSKLSTVTHLSLAYWPDPCFTPRARCSSVASPQGNNIPYGGTNYYSHTIDQDWSEALLVLRMLSKNLYKLEFLDLTGCASWFQALIASVDHDFVDWNKYWGKISVLRLYAGETPADDAQPSQKIAFREAIDMAIAVERHIRAMRAGRGRLITVERNQIEN